MRIFVSYARVDKPYCIQIVDMLDAHDVWYDKRIHAGEQWWDTICKRIDWCEGFVYLLSPDSVASEYCQREYEIARAAGKHIFPVLIHAKAVVPESLQKIHYADLTKGLTPEAVKTLLNAIYVVERRVQPQPQPQPVPEPAAVGNGNGAGVTVAAAPTVPIVRPAFNSATLIDDVAAAMDAKNFDRAVFLLKQAKESAFKPRFINLEAMLYDAEVALERQSYLREAEREYQPIISLAKRAQTRKLGCKAFQSFREHFPDYDPENIASICATVMLPMLEWCVVPSGEVTLEYTHKQVTYFVPQFQISRYPITNAQFQVFADAEDGYKNNKWWEYSPRAKTWHEQHPEPMQPKFSWGDHPRGNVCWYEALAFCGWLAEKTGLNVTLPTEQQWQRAAQGDDSRAYPWGNRFDKNKCNTRESKLRMTCSVTRYKNGVSPYGVYDMAGNVWQWCDGVDYDKRGLNAQTEDIPRAVRGGSFISVAQRAKTNFHFYLNPLYRYATIGFRVATTT